MFQMTPWALFEHQNIAKKGQKLILGVFKNGISQGGGGAPPPSPPPWLRFNPYIKV